MDIAIIVSIISVVIAAITLFLTHLRPPKFTLNVGPSMKLYYTSGGGLSCYLPITFINTSPRTGAVLRMTLTLFRRDVPETRYLFEWRSFSRFEPGTGAWVYQDMAHAVAVPGNAALGKTVWFSWPEDSGDKPVLREGAYVLVLHRWIDDRKPPIADRHELILSGQDVAALEMYRAQRNSTTIDVVLDHKVGGNRVLTHREYEQLLPE